MPYLIDGYNLLWSAHKLDDDSAGVSDVEMCQMIDRFLCIRGDRGQVIFDGTGPPDKSGFEYFKNLEVFFSGLRTEADTIIEYRISDDSAARNLYVVSTDRRIRKAAKARKAISIKSETFWEKISNELSRTRKSRQEPPEKRRGLSESETNWWLKFFGIK